jgi:hypothetical protein
MKRKLAIYAAAAILILVTITLLDRYKVYKEEKPPFPAVTVEGEEVPIILGGYDWHGKKIPYEEGPLKGMAKMEASPVREKQRLDVTFPAGQEPESIIISQVNSVPGGEKLAEQSRSLIIPKSSTTQPIHFQITALWNEEMTSFSTYYVKLDIEDLPKFHDFLSKDPNKLSVLAVVPQGDSEKDDIPDDLKTKLDSYQISENPEGMMAEYPELPIYSVPVYFIFNSETLIFETNFKEILIENLIEKQKVNDN